MADSPVLARCDRIRDAVLANRSGLLVLSLAVSATWLRLPNPSESLWSDQVTYGTQGAVASVRGLGWVAADDPSAPVFRILMFFRVRALLPSWRITIRSCRSAVDFALHHSTGPHRNRDCCQTE